MIFRKYSDNYRIFASIMDIKEKRIILGSNSPRRKELLAGLDIAFEVDTRNNFEETYAPETPHEKIPEVLSEGKSYGFHRELEDDEIDVAAAGETHQSEPPTEEKKDADQG